MQSDLKNLSNIRNFIEEEAEKIGLSEVAISEIRLAVDEACANIIIHGYKNNSGDLDITVKFGNNKMIVTLGDHAPLYNPLKETPRPNLESPLNERPLGGMGVLLVKQNTDAIEYRVTANGGNALILTKFCSDPTTRSEY